MNKKQTNKTRTGGERLGSVMKPKKWTLVMLAIVFGLCGCGNKGDLYLPEKSEGQQTTEQKAEAKASTEKSVE